MSDVARLGLAIDSSQAVAAKKALDDFSASGKSAQAAANGLQKSMKPAQDAAAGLAKSGQLARHEMINLSRQVQDVFVSLASGQPIWTVAIQQGAQFADIYGSSKTGTVGGSLKQVGSAIASVITPVRLLGAGIVAAGAAAVIGISSWKAYTLQLDDAARAAGTTAQSLTALQAAASFKGISGDDFNKAILQFGRSVYDARNNMGALADVFRANNTSAKDFADALNKAADLIKNARNDQQRLVLLQQMGLPPTMEWVRLLSNGADGLREAQEQAARFSADDGMIRKAREFDEAWNKATTNLGRGLRSAIVDAIGWFQQLSNKGTGVLLALGVDVGRNLLKNQQNTGTSLSSSDIDEFQKAVGLGGDTSKKNTVDPNALKNAIALEQQRLGILGQTATVQQQVRAVELQVQSARLNGVRITESEEAALKRLAAAQALGITQIQGATDAMRVEAATIGMSVGDATAYAAAQNAINEARRAGRELTPDNIAQIKREAAALGEAAAQADSLRWQYENLVRGPLQTFTSAISNGATAWEAFKKAGQSALNAIASKLMDMAAQNLWKSAFGGSSGGGFGGLLSGLFGGGGNSAPTWSTGLGAGTGGLAFPTFDVGGFTGMGGKYEPAGIVHKGEYVFDAASTRRIGVGNLERLRGYAEGGIVDSMPRLSMPGRASNDNGSGGAQNVHVTVGVTVDNDGNLQAYVKNVAQTESQKSVTGFVRSPAFTEHVAVANVKARTQRLGR